DLGGTVNLELPVAAGELGVVLLAAAPLPLPVSVGALAGGFQLDPTSVVTVLAGTGTGQGPLQAQLGIPHVPFLSRRAVYLQRVRATSPMPTGHLTRLVELPLFCRRAPGRESGGSLFARARRAANFAGMPIRDSLRFFGAFVRHPGSVGSVWPSSRALAE